MLWPRWSMLKLASEGKYCCIASLTLRSGAADTTCRHKARDITPFVIGGERHGKRKCSVILLEWTREGYHQSDKHQRQCWGNIWEMGWSTYWHFWVYKYQLEWNCAELMLIIFQLKWWIKKLLKILSKDEKSNCKKKNCPWVQDRCLIKNKK